MLLSITFRGLTDEVRQATVDLRVEDQSEMDAPAVQVANVQLGPFLVTPSNPTVRSEVEFPTSDAEHELTLVVRINGVGHEGHEVKYLNTTSVCLPQDRQGTVEVEVFRIS